MRGKKHFNCGLHAAILSHPQAVEERSKEVEKTVPTQKFWQVAAVTEADKSKLLLEEDLSDKAWIFQPKS